MFENPRRGRQARSFTTNVPKILNLKSSSEQIFSENCRWVPLTTIRRGCAKYRDQFLSVSQVNYSAEENNWSAKCTDKSGYFAITESNDFFIIWSPSLIFRMNIFRKRGDLPFSHKGDREKEKSVVLFTHDQNINYLQPNISDHIAHEQTIYCWQLFAGHVVGPRPMNSPYSLWNLRNL